MKVIKSILIVIVMLAALGAVGFAYLAQSSRNGSAPGLVDGSLAPCPGSPNCVSSEAGTDSEKAVEPLPAGSWDALPAAISAMGGVITAKSEEYIAAEFSSSTFGFVDDLELRRGEDAVHIRSASRVGYSDGGVNAKRVAELRAKVEG